MEILRNVIDDNKFTPENVPLFEAKLFFEGDKRRINRERFAVLLFLSTVIATYGVLGDSTATVIGAMIIAPLMIPIMATAAGLVMGDMRRAGRALLTVVAGVIGVIFTAWLIGAFLNTTIVSFASNTQIVGRISPSLTDLAIALACGAAGAFAMSRPDVADSLPGVAISISLVPPLCVVGIGLAGGEWTVAWGAMLLFLTNFLSILLAGGGTLALLGLSAASTGKLIGNARRRAFTYIALGTLLVAIPLAATTYQASLETIVELEIEQAAKEWLAATEYEVSKVTANGNQVVVIIDGSGEPPPSTALAEVLQSELGTQTQVSFKFFPSIQRTYPEPISD
jgi:uncharacterized hydrophobic protein (TIGR00271 family)